MKMADKRKLPAEYYEETSLQYRWYVNYDRADEYDKNPIWTQDIAEKYITVEVGDVSYTAMRFDNVHDENRWVQSDIVIDLTDAL